MADADVKQLLLQVDASVELLRRNLTAGAAQVDRFTADTQRRLDATDRRFASFGKPLEGIGATVTRTNAQIATLGNTFQSVERRMVASAGNIRSALLASTAGIAAAFSLDRIVEFADGYTRFTNQLKVAGLEGQGLSRTQEDLFAIAQRYGVQLEAVGTLYGRLSQGSKELGASQGDLLRFTSGVGAALKVQGGDAAASAGALLQLTQALGGTYVRAEEFNSINEGARPILQAVANGIDRFGGSVSKLRSEVLAGTLTSREFFGGFLRGSEALEAQAGKAGLTISASFTILNNALGKYIGEADQSLSATERLSAGITGLANNLNIIIPALASIATGYAAIKAGSLAVGLVDKGIGAAEGTTAAILRGNAAYIDGLALKAKSALAARETAAAEVAAIEQVLAARRADAAQLEVNLALIAEQRAAAQQSQAAIATAQSQGFGTLGQGGATRTGAQIDAGRALKAEVATKQALTAVNAEVAAGEEALAAARTRSTAATIASDAATKAATIGARASAAATALLTGALNLFVAALPVIAIGALVAAFLHMREAAAASAERIKAFDQHGRDLDRVLKEIDASARAAAGGIAQTAGQAAAATGSMRAFAGAIGEAADRLYQLAKARRHEQVVAALGEEQKAKQDAADARAAIEGRQTATFVGARSTSPAADAADRKRIADADRRAAAARAGAEQAARIPLLNRLSTSEKNGGRDVDGDLATARRDLKIAQAGGNKGEVNRLKAQVFELTQYNAYRKGGASDESARAQASADAGRLRQAGQGRIDAAAGRAADRTAASARRREAALVVDAANDTRAYKAAERQANDAIASANAELTNSAVARAQIERERVEADRQSKNEEIAQQGVAGRYTAERVKSLQALNDQAAKAQTAVIDQREQQRAEQDATDLAIRGLSVQRDLLGEQANLATTAIERRTIELRILALQKREEELRLQRILAFNSGASESDRGQALIDLNTLDARYGARQAGVIAGTRGPAEQYQFALNSRSINEQLESVQTGGLDRLEDGLTGIVTGTQSVTSAFKSMAASIIADLARIAIQQAIIKPIASSLFGGGFGFADGGPVLRLATGGPISGPGGPRTDSIPAMLSNGEYVINAAATAANRPLLDAINTGRLRHFADGGPVTPSAIVAPSAPRITGMGRAGTSRTQVELTARVEASELLEVKMQEVSARQISAAVPAIADLGAAKALNVAGRRPMPKSLG